MCDCVRAWSHVERLSLKHPQSVKESVDIAFIEIDEVVFEISALKV